jgi:integrase/recombinase XerD
MKLAEAAACYVAHKQAMGMRFRTEARIVSSNRRCLMSGCQRQLATFLAGAGLSPDFGILNTAFCEGLQIRHCAWLCEALGSAEPCSKTVRRPLFPIFTPGKNCAGYWMQSYELIIPSVDHHRNVIDPETYRVVLLLLYGAELRISEALALSRADINLAAGTPLIRWQEQPALLEFLRPL